MFHVILFEDAVLNPRESRPNRRTQLCRVLADVARSRAGNTTIMLWACDGRDCVNLSPAQETGSPLCPGKYDLGIVHYSDKQALQGNGVHCVRHVWYSGGRIANCPAGDFCLRGDGFLDSSSPLTEDEATQIIDWVAKGFSTSELPRVLAPVQPSSGETNDLLRLLCSAYLIRGKEVLQSRGEQVPASSFQAYQSICPLPGGGSMNPRMTPCGAQRIDAGYWGIDGTEATGDDRFRELCNEDVYAFTSRGLETVATVFVKLTREVSQS